MTGRKQVDKTGSAGEGQAESHDHIDPREAALAEREAALDARERELMDRASRLPREREAEPDRRSRAYDESHLRERAAIDAFSPVAMLETPQDPQYYYRWIGEFVNGNQTPNTVQRALRQGFVRVMISELPEDFVVDEDRGDGVARNSGLILMRQPWTQRNARNDYYRRRAAERSRSVDTLQGVRPNEVVHEDRGSRPLTGNEASSMLAKFTAGG